MSHLITFQLENGVLLDLPDQEFPVRVRGLRTGELALEAEWTHYGAVVSGTATVRLSGIGEIRLQPGMYFAVPGSGWAFGSGSAVLVISRKGPPGLFQIGGPLEPQGRLRYIDGCSDTLLISPPRCGDPCLNHLHVPLGTSQSAHTHPSDRIGAVFAGSAHCRTSTGVTELQTGTGWYIPAGCEHAFATGESTLDVVAWHPDSDFGPTDENHPMRNQTHLRSHSNP